MGEVEGRIRARSLESCEKERRKRIAICLVVTCLLLGLFSYGAEYAAADTTKAITPTGKYNAHLKWKQSFGGTDYSNSPTPPVLYEGCIYTFAGNYIYKLNSTTGAIEAKSGYINGTPRYSTIPVLCANGSVFAFATRRTKNEEGKSIVVCNVIKADCQTLELQSLSEDFRGQNITPMTFYDGHIYGGGWVDKEAVYFCIDAASMQTSWTFNDPNNAGYYWAGAYVDSDVVVFGSDSGTVYSIRNDTSLNGGEAELIDSLQTGSAVRSSMRKDENNNLYFATNNGVLHKIALETDGTLRELGSETIGDSSVNTPIITGELLYITSNTGLNIFDISGNGLVKLTSASAPGYIKGEMLYSSGAQALYGGFYSIQGPMYFFKLSSDGRTVVDKDILFTPENMQFNISPVTADGSGNIYFKNDSGYIFCITSGYRTDAITSVSAKAIDFRSIEFSWSGRNDISGFEVRRSRDGKNWTTIKKELSPSTLKWIDTSAKVGTTYLYSVRAQVSGNTYTSWSNAKKAKTSLKRPVMKGKSKKKAAAISWKKVAGAQGYVIYRATKKTGKYNKAKVISKGNIVKWSNKKLKRKKIYYYKMKAYRKVGGKKVYSPWSKTIRVKIK